MEEEERRQLLQVKQTMETPGWTRILQLWAELRERLIRDFRRASLNGISTGHGPEYYQGRFDGFEEAVDKAASAHDRG
jgi:hypothetical protein